MAALPLSQASAIGVAPNRFRVRLGPGPEQPVEELRVVVPGRPVQRRRAVGRPSVRIGTSCEQRDRRHPLAGLHGLHQPQVVAAVLRRRTRRDEESNGSRNQQRPHHLHPEANLNPTQHSKLKTHD
jgi:hypothetical protein